GGSVCFDFVNTVPSRTESPQRDYLKTYTDLLILCERTEMLSENRLDTLSKFAASNKPKARHALREMKKNRNILYHFFSKIAAKKLVDKKLLDSFNKLLAEALSNIRMVGAGTSVERGWNE